MHSLIINIKKNIFGKSFIIVSTDFVEIKQELQNLKDELKITSADYLEIEELPNIKINHIRETQRFLSFKPHSSQYKIAMIFVAGKLTDEAANALLKTLEEPQEKSIIILVVKNKKDLLSTIISRCQIIRTNQYKKISNSDLAKAEKELENIKNYSISERFNYVKNIINKKVNICELLYLYLVHYREQYLLAPTSETKNIIIIIIRSLKLLLKTNTNPRLMLENLLLIM